MNSKLVLFTIIASLAVVAAGFWLYPQISQNPAALQTNQQISSQETGPGIPSRLIIESIGVNANIEHLGLAQDGSVDVPKGPFDTAWYQLGPRPGAKGSAIITGHFGTWVDGSHSVFDNLYKLKRGDSVQVTDGKGKTLTFIVRETRTYNPSESPPEVFSKTDGIYLNLITCNGDWIANKKTYTKRLVVFTDLVQ